MSTTQVSILNLYLNKSTNYKMEIDKEIALTNDTLDSTISNGQISLMNTIQH